MLADDVLSSAWMEDARHAYNDRIQDVEAEAGECMQECCRRDLKNQVYSAKMNSRLKTFDPSSQAVLIRDAVAADPLASRDMPEQQRQVANTTTTATQFAQPDARMPAAAARDIEEIRQQRMKSMLRRRDNEMAAADAGFGSLRDVSTAKAKEAVADASAAVVHLWEAGFGSELDEALSQFAMLYKGTRFVRTPVARCAAWLQRLRQTQQPLLLAAKQGQIVGVVPVGDLVGLSGDAEAGADGCDSFSDVSSDFGGSDAAPSLEAAAEGWLRRLGVLRTRAPDMGTAFGGEGLVPGDSSEEEGAEQEGDEWRTPCVLCGRTYPHTHKRAVRAGGNHLSDSDSAED